MKNITNVVQNIIILINLQTTYMLWNKIVNKNNYPAIMQF